MAALATVASAGIASAGSLVLDGLGGPVLMQSKDLSSDVFNAGSPNFTNDAMAFVTNDIKASGITMDRLVTFLLADTDDGLAFLAIADDITQTDGGKILTGLGMSTTGPDTANGYINDAAEDIDQYFDPPNATQTYAGFFNWNAARQADGFAWSQLQSGDFLTFDFSRNSADNPTHPGLQRPDTFQFVSWNGTDWEVVAIGDFTNNNQFAFSLTVIPLPAPVLLGVAGLALAGVARRRMMKKA
jgi:hypothetical protein